MLDVEASYTEFAKFEHTRRAEECMVEDGRSSQPNLGSEETQAPENVNLSCPQRPWNTLINVFSLSDGTYQGEGRLSF
jgi:hypothetical protein